MRLITIIVLIFTISCTTNDITINDIEETEIWEVTSFNQNERKLIPEIFKKSYAIHYKKQDVIVIHYNLNEVNLNRLEEKWAKKYKNIKLSSVTVLQEITFSRSDNNITFNSIANAYIIDGDNTEKLQKKLNHQVHNIKINESSGIIGLMLEKSYPTPLSQIPTPELSIGIPYEINQEEELFTIQLKKTKIELKYKNEFRFIDD